MENIIDSSCFQRLRNIRQTSYSPLYPSALHNRFIHSIGVYYLGKIAIKTLKPTIDKLGLIDINTDIFLLACLLHDVGHAPFSHTGEKYFVQGQIPTINDELVSEVGDEDLRVEVQNKYFKEAAPHEIMSVIVALRSFPNCFNKAKERDFFARCITGYKYRKNGQYENICNCLIELLNSTIIDIDKLDYIIRDAQTTGYQSVSIDYIRLLGALSIIDYAGKKTLAYNKSALSVIENVIYAHDFERKWIQSHPVVLYEHFLIQYAIKKIERQFSDDDKNESLFCFDSLTDIGKTFKNGSGKISLLADEDLLHIMKSNCMDILIHEYFSRNERRHPIWKSEAEYRLLFDNVLGNGELLDLLENDFKEVEKYIGEKIGNNLPIINDHFIQHCNDRLQKIKDLPDEQKAVKDDLSRGIRILLMWANGLREFALASGIPFDFVIIMANKFRSSFLKEDLEKIVIDFSSLGKKELIKKIASILSGDKQNRENLFYIFYKRTKKINANELADIFFKVLIDRKKEV